MLPASAGSGSLLQLFVHSDKALIKKQRHTAKRIFERLRDEHQQILQTLEARDPMAARQAMQTHLGRLILFLIPLEKDHPEFFVSA